MSESNSKLKKNRPAMETPSQEGHAEPTQDLPVEAGELTVGEMRLIEQLRSTASQVINEIGHLEVRKSQLLSRLSHLEAQGQSVLNTAAKRLDITDGETWHLTPEGKVRRGPSPTV